MKTILKWFALTCCVLSAGLQVYAQGYIVPNGISYGGYTSGLGSEIDVLYNPTAVPPTVADYTGFFLKPQSANAFSYSYIVNAGVRVFLTSQNDPMTLDAILSQGYTELGGSQNYTFEEGSPFYVGVYTGNDYYGPVDGIYAHPLYGWAELENVGGTIQLLNSALEYQGGGIFVGTQTIIPVPEPSCFALVGMGAFFFGLRRGRLQS